MLTNDEYEYVIQLVENELGAAQRARLACAKQRAMHGAFTKAYANAQRRIELLLPIKAKLVTMQARKAEGE